MPKAINQHLGADGQPFPEAYYVRLSEDTYASTLYAQGFWQEGEQHMAAASGLLLHHIENALPSAKLISRVSFDIFGVIHSGEFTIAVTTVRPGATIELIEATMLHAGRASVTARVWRLVSSDTSAVAGTPHQSLVPRSECTSIPLPESWGGGFINSLQMAFAPDREPGRAGVWLSSSPCLVAGEPRYPYADFVKFVDGMNGLAARADPREVFFANVDLSIHFLRPPMGAWAGFDIRVSFGDAGLGITEATLYDEHGLIGKAAQSLTIRMGRT